MTLRDKILIWTLGIVVIALFISSISTILLPFVVALIVSYFLDPAVDKIEHWGTSRAFATSTITIVFFMLLGLVLILVLPILYDQSIAMINQIPQYVNKINEQTLPMLTSVLEKIDPEALTKAKESVSQISVYVFSFLTNLLANLWDSGVAMVNILSLMFVTPVVTFYMLRDWDIIVKKVNKWVPRHYASTIKAQAKQIDRTLSGYIHGQTNVCLLLGTFYAIGLSMAGLDFGFVIGMATGILSFIPYVGLLFGFFVGLLVAFFQFGDLTNVMIIAAIFIIGHAIESTFITPKLVGDKVGLHPVWIIFGMLAGAAIFGFTGILLAVPVTAVIGVLARFFIGQYLKSSLYKG